jgi:hypothetical protein
MTAFEPAEVPHPFASLSEEELALAADRVVADLHRIILRAEARQSVDVARP